MFKYTYTRVPQSKSPAYGQVWTHTVEEVDEALAAEFETLSPRMQFLAAYGWKQKLPDGASAAKTEDEFRGFLDKNRDAVVDGTVRDRDIAVAPIKTPIEREIERLATEAINQIIKGTENEKMPRDRKMAYVELYMENHDEELRTAAKANLGGIQKVRSVTKDDLDALIAAKVAEVLVPEVPAEEKPEEKPAKSRRAA